MNSFKLQLYRYFLRLPKFRGKGRLEGWLRQRMWRIETASVNNGIKMWLDPHEWVQIGILEKGCTEPLTEQLFGRLLSPGNVYMDVGSHVGYLTLVARKLVGNSGRVVAIDPQPYNCERLLTNWRLNGFENVSVHVAAAGDKEGQVKLQEQPSTDKAKLSLLTGRPNAPARQFTVSLRRLESIIEAEKLELVTLLKIDTEGYEHAVLKGLGKAIQNVENMVLELLPEVRTGGDSAEQICSLLRAAGFELCTVEGKAWQLPDHLPENNLWAHRVRPLASGLKPPLRK